MRENASTSPRVRPQARQRACTRPRGHSSSRAHARSREAPRGEGGGGETKGTTHRMLRWPLLKMLHVHHFQRQHPLPRRDARAPEKRRRRNGCDAYALACPFSLPLPARVRMQRSVLLTKRSPLPASGQAALFAPFLRKDTRGTAHAQGHGEARLGALSPRLDPSLFPPPPPPLPFFRPCQRSCPKRASAKNSCLTHTHKHNRERKGGRGRRSEKENCARRQSRGPMRFWTSKAREPGGGSRGVPFIFGKRPETKGNGIKTKGNIK